VDAGSVCPSQTCGTCPSGFTCSAAGQCSALAPCNVNLVVVDRISNATIGGQCTLSIRGTTVTYTNGNFIWTSPSTSWDVAGGFGTYAFGTTCPGYQVSNETITVTTTTTTVTLHVTPAPIPVEVYKSGDFSQQLSVTCQIEVTGPNFYFSSFSWTRNTGVTFSGHTTNGFAPYEFSTTCPGFTPSVATINVNVNLKVIQLQVSASTVTIVVKEKNGDQLDIVVGASIRIEKSSTFIQTYNWIPGVVNTWIPPSYGEFTFETAATGYLVNKETVNVLSTTNVITLYVFGCGDGFCSDGENWDFCPQDCGAISLIFERYDGNTPVFGYTVDTFSSDPRTFGGQFGPVFNNATITGTRTLPTSSNVILLSEFESDEIVFLRVSVAGYINFFWTVDLSLIATGQLFTLRGHLSPLFTSSNLPYRVVNTWRTTDNEPAPYSPTDLNLHLFFSDGSPCDINNRNVTTGGSLRCSSIADNKQAGGPASIDFVLDANSPITTWNSKPPRNPTIAPSQNNRYLVNSGSYIVYYGVTADSATGKQLGEVVLGSALKVVAPSNTFNIWRQADITVAQPRQGGLTVTEQNYLGVGTIDAAQNMFFNCQIHSSCSNFMIPYADTGR